MKALIGMAGYTVAPCRWPRAWHRRREAANGVSFTTVCPLVVTDARGAEQAWMFEARPRVHVDGIPMGRAPSGFFLIGTREQCEAMRLCAQSRADRSLWNWNPTPEPVPPSRVRGRSVLLTVIGERPPSQPRCVLRSSASEPVSSVTCRSSS